MVSSPPFSFTSVLELSFIFFLSISFYFYDISLLLKHHDDNDQKEKKMSMSLSASVCYDFLDRSCPEGTRAILEELPPSRCSGTMASNIESESEAVESESSCSILLLLPCDVGCC